MSATNQFVIIGKLTKNPEWRECKDGRTRFMIHIAQNKFWKDKDEVRREKTCYFQLSAYGALGDTLANYVQKGSNVCFTGWIETYETVNPDGSVFRGTNLNIKEFEILDPKAKDTWEYAKDI